MNLAEQPIMVKVCKGCFKFTLSFNISLWEAENCIAQGQKLNECWTWTHPYWIVGAVSIYSTPTKKFMVHVDLQSRKSIQVAASILLVCWLALVWFGLVVRSSRLCTRSALPRFFPGGLLQTFQMRETLQALHTPASSQAAATLRV